MVSEESQTQLICVRVSATIFHLTQNHTVIKLDFHSSLLNLWHVGVSANTDKFGNWFNAVVFDQCAFYLGSLLEKGLRSACRTKSACV